MPKKTISIKAKELENHIVAIAGNGKNYSGVMHFSSSKFAYACTKTLRALEQEFKDTREGFEKLSAEFEAKRAKYQSETHKIILEFVPNATALDLEQGVEYSRAGAKAEELKKKHNALKDENKELLDELDRIEKVNQGKLEALGEIEVEIYTIGVEHLPPQINGIQMNAIMFMVDEDE